MFESRLKESFHAVGAFENDLPARKSSERHEFHGGSLVRVRKNGEFSPAPTFMKCPRYSTLFHEIIGASSLEIIRVQHTRGKKKVAQTRAPEQKRLLLSFQ